MQCYDLIKKAIGGVFFSLSKMGVYNTTNLFLFFKKDVIFDQTLRLIA